FEGRVFRVVSTGIFAAQPVGQASYPNETVWRDINPSNPGDNVYFELEPTEDVPPGDQIPTEVLRVWTSHIALLFGRPMKIPDDHRLAGAPWRGAQPERAALRPPAAGAAVARRPPPGPGAGRLSGAAAPGRDLQQPHAARAANRRSCPRAAHGFNADPY